MKMLITLMTKGFGAPGAVAGSAACPLVAGHQGLVNLTRRQTSESERSWLDQINRDVRLEISWTFGQFAASGEQGACPSGRTRGGRHPFLLRFCLLH